jgi:hypothetical protein
VSLGTYEHKSTLLFTGHSAGAATASLLYAHVRSEAVSPLASVASKFANVHCILFGCPPISISPLQQYIRKNGSSSSSLFLSFLNHGDPVIKADGGYIVRKCGWPLPAYADSREDWECEAVASFTGTIAKPKRLYVHSGSLFLMTLETDLSSVPAVRKVDNDELDGDAAISWRVHGIRVYKKRIDSLQAGRDCVEDLVLRGDNKEDSVIKTDTHSVVEDTISRGWLNIMFF